MGKKKISVHILGGLLLLTYINYSWYSPSLLLLRKVKPPQIPTLYLIFSSVIQILIFPFTSISNNRNYCCYSLLLGCLYKGSLILPTTLQSRSYYLNSINEDTGGLERFISMLTIMQLNNGRFEINPSFLRLLYNLPNSLTSRQLADSRYLQLSAPACPNLGALTSLPPLFLLPTHLALCVTSCFL